MPFQPGESGNPNGRKPGVRNKRTEEIFIRLESRGDKDPADFLSAIVTSETESKELRVQAANFLLPYKYGKRGIIPVPRFIDEPVQLPHPRATTFEQANANIAFLSDLKAQGQLDLESADSLIADNRTIANNLIAEEELKLKITNQGGGPNPVIHITGGLPPLPGTSVIMDDTALANGPPPDGPLLNGHNGHGPVIDHEPTQTAIESAPSNGHDPDTTNPSRDLPTTDQEPESCSS